MRYIVAILYFLLLIALSPIMLLGFIWFNISFAFSLGYVDLAQKYTNWIRKYL